MLAPSTLIGLAALPLLAASAAAQPFTRIYHSTETVLPGSPVTKFDGLDRDGPLLYFRIFREDGSHALVRKDAAGLSIVADSTAPIPGIGTVSVIREPAAAQSKLATIVRNSDFTLNAILVQDGSGWNQLVNNTTINPVTGAPFILGTQPISFDGERLVFQVNTSIFQWHAGAVTTIATPNQNLPGTTISLPYMTSLVQPVLDSGATYFVAGSGAFNNSVWKGSNGTTTLVLPAGTQVPAGQVAYCQAIAAHGDRVLVGAMCQQQSRQERSLLLVRDNIVTTVIDETTPWEGQRLSLSLLNFSMTIDDHQLAFNATVGTGAGSEGFNPQLFVANADGSNLRILIQKDDALDGRTVGTVRVYPESARDGDLIFAVKFADGTRGLYSTRPAPTCGIADFNNDGDSGTDADIEAFFACLAGNCCPTCGTVDFNGDGDFGTDADIESFFRVLAGGPC